MPCICVCVIFTHKLACWISDLFKLKGILNSLFCKSYNMAIKNIYIPLLFLKLNNH